VVCPQLISIEYPETTHDYGSPEWARRRGKEKEKEKGGGGRGGRGMLM